VLLLRVAGPALFAAAAIVAFACYLRMSLTVPVNSDGASNALQAWDMLHGNLLLHGWWLSDVSFYTTELPEYMLVELAHGLNADVVHIGAGLTYTLLTALAALLAKGGATGTQGWIRMLIAPSTPTTSAATRSRSGARTCCAAFPQRRTGAGNGAGRVAALMTRLRGFPCDASLLRSCYL